MKRSLYLPGGSPRRFDAVPAVGAAAPVNDAEIVPAVGATALVAHPSPALGAAALVNDDEIVGAAAHPPPPAVGAAAPVNDDEIVPAVGAAAPAAHPPDSGSEMSTDEEDDILHG
jgi:hypothetical protein